MTAPSIPACFKYFLPEDLLLGGRTLWGEARGEAYDHKVKIAHVILNRWIRTDGQFGKDDTFATTCLRHLQFSPWNANDPNFPKLFSIGLGDPILRDCVRAILQAISEKEQGYDVTLGATHYHTIAKPSWAKQWPPDWAEGQKPCLIDGGHMFYNTVR